MTTGEVERLRRVYQTGKDELQFSRYEAGALELRFKDKKVRELCERQQAAERKLGPVCARKLRARLSDLESAARVSDLIAGRPHPLSGDRAGQLAVDLAGGTRLVFSADHDPCPTRPDGGIDWTQVTAICIEFIGNYHD